MKPLIDVLFDKGCFDEHGFRMDFSDNVPKNKVQTFVLSPEVALSAEMLVRSSSFKMPTLEELRMPYEHMAIEYPLTDEVKKLRTNGLNGTVPITRVGIYIRVVGNNMFTCLPYWEYVDKRVQHSLFTFCFGLNDKLVDHVYIGRSEDDLLLANVIPCNSLIVGATKMGITPEMMSNSLSGSPEVLAHIKESAIEIPVLMFACSLLINCKSGIGTVKVPAKHPPMGIKLGGKKKKQMSVSSYTLMYLNEIEFADSNGSVNKRTDISAHYVRGHFKQRKKGIYWWNSFIRGNGEPKKRVAYLVEERELA